ncbi:MAG TPA: peptidase T, partial [Planctomycetaceae bacterium]|nr:peptidase T [Planctomycetaceae bacterium]
MTRINGDRLLDRFLQYVRVDTTANDATDDYPSSPGQWELGKLLVRQLEELGACDVRQDAHGLVWARVPANVEGAPTIAFNAHLDTSPETTGAGVRPQVISPYSGGDIVLPGDPSQ